MCLRIEVVFVSRHVGPLWSGLSKSVFGYICYIKEYELKELKHSLVMQEGATRCMQIEYISTQALFSWWKCWWKWWKFWGGSVCDAKILGTFEELNMAWIALHVWCDLFYRQYLVHLVMQAAALYDWRCPVSLFRPPKLSIGTKLKQVKCFQKELLEPFETNQRWTRDPRKGSYTFAWWDCWQQFPNFIRDHQQSWSVPSSEVTKCDTNTSPRRLVTHLLQ
jgi:hypothetical protein